ncbi:ankyrin repeat domain-containing protein [Wolbachia endosymbiont of Cylisticus convexus]|uniref:ankyrin repeat domain-containing protein n=1 Tax=Wolbachia endosymbiont of Cylisticus convexus TaxID=118728 RepID=UPI000DF69013|nr:ankyrin repeat domain-containing protein [Wolbachia endosymbiont of Cylisticus convexus]RDD34548.1 ankyrin repeat domain-containing protein [Wolbachia endosymbiont of Cylisticus convexus]
MNNTSILQKILYRIDNDDKVSSSNIIEKFKSELQQHDVDMYNAWEENGFDINANSFGGSNLLCLASENGCAKVVELLIEKDANVNIRDNEGKAPLHYAVIIPGQNTWIVERLLNKGAEINIQDNEGKTPLHLAASDIVSSFWGTKETKEENVKMLLDKGAEVNIQDNEGRTPLHLAVSTPGQSIWMAERLLNKGVEVDIRDNEGKTPFHLAASCSNSLCKYFVEMLLKNGAEINIRDNEGKTPLDYAISSKKEEVIEILTGKILLSDEGLTSQMSSEQEVEIDSQDQYENPLSYYFFS